MKPGVRFPLEPLADYLGFELGVMGGQKPGDPPVGLTAMTGVLGLSSTTLKRYRNHGMTEEQADRCACRAGAHPAWIWPRLWRQSIHASLTAPVVPLGGLAPAVDRGRLVLVVAA